MICLISGTSRPQSQTRRVTRIFEKLFQTAGANTSLVDLNKLPAELFLPSAYAEKPASFAPTLKTILDAKGLFLVTPEYNGSFPGVLKHFIDLLKFPESFEHKPVAFVGVAAGMWGALRSVEQLSHIFQHRNAFVFSDRIFLPKVETQLTAEGEFTSSLIKELAEKQVRGFIDFCQKMDPSHPKGANHV